MGKNTKGGTSELQCMHVAGIRGRSQKAVLELVKITVLGMAVWAACVDTMTGKHTWQSRLTRLNILQIGSCFLLYKDSWYYYHKRVHQTFVNH